MIKGVFGGKPKAEIGAMFVEGDEDAFAVVAKRKLKSDARAKRKAVKDNKASAVTNKEGHSGKLGCPLCLVPSTPQASQGRPPGWACGKQTTTNKRGRPVSRAAPFCE